MRNLHVSAEYLFNPTAGDDDKGLLSGDEMLVMELYKKIDVEKQRYVLDTLQLLNKLQEFENEHNYED